MQRLPQGLQLLDEPLSFSWSKSAQELKLVVHVVMIDKKIDVDAHSVDELNVGLLEAIYKSSLVDVFLEVMQIHVESLVL
jgi:CII-binding regulator of phage lambda lysogenization HflD